MRSDDVIKQSTHNKGTHINEVLPYKINFLLYFVSEEFRIRGPSHCPCTGAHCIEDRPRHIELKIILKYPDEQVTIL
jgi:hypothetical protein